MDMKGYLSVAFIAAVLWLVPVAAFAAGSPMEAAGGFLDDAATTAEIKLRLAAQQGLDSNSVHVTTDDGIVYCNGLVGSAAQAALAEEVARGLSSVKGVKNNLEITD